MGMDYTNNTFDPSRLLANGTAGQLSSTAVAPVAAQESDSVDPVYRAKATEAAVKFESFFIGHMLHQMRDGTRALAADDSPSKDRINQDMLDMADNLVADQLAGKRAFGVADAILRQLLPQQPAQPVQAQAAAKVSDSQNLSIPLNQQQ
jgi:flagellar protein FlgJ